MFIIYINDITESIESAMLIFADDTSLLINDKTPKITSKMLNRDLKRIYDWAHKWKVNLHSEKSEEIIFQTIKLQVTPPYSSEKNRLRE